MNYSIETRRTRGSRFFRGGDIIEFCIRDYKMIEQCSGKVMVFHNATGVLEIKEKSTKVEREVIQQAIDKCQKFVKENYK